jgi:hypothetical protein
MLKISYIKTCHAQEAVADPGSIIYPFQIDLILYRSICRTELIEGLELHGFYRIAKLEEV